jgi:hypothetical protein
MCADIPEAVTGLQQSRNGFDTPAFKVSGEEAARRGKAPQGSTITQQKGIFPAHELLQYKRIVNKEH